jgi:hypothetical protein
VTKGYGYRKGRTGGILAIYYIAHKIRQIKI